MEVLVGAMGEDAGGRRRGSTQALKGTVQGGPRCVGVGGADHMGELGFNQGLVDRLGGRPDADDAVTAFDTWTSDLTMALMGRGPACSLTSKLQSGVDRPGDLGGSDSWEDAEPCQHSGSTQWSCASARSRWCWRSAVRMGRAGVSSFGWPGSWVFTRRRCGRG